MLFKPFHKSSVLKTYLKILPLALKKRYGKHKRYTKDQIRETIDLVGLDTEYIHYAYAAFLSHSDFKALDQSQTSDRDYGMLRYVTKTDGFISLSQWLLSLDFNPLLSIFVSVSLISAIVGSSTGGLQIFLSSMSESYLDKGVEPEMLHRVATMASGGFDSLPHCGAVVAVLAIAGLTHKEGYKDIGIVTVVIPVFATLASIGIYSIW